MKRSKPAKKMQYAEKSNIYYAVKSKNDIYYQMASIFNAAKKEDDTLVKEIFTSASAGCLFDKFLENSL